MREVRISLEGKCGLEWRLEEVGMMGVRRGDGDGDGGGDVDDDDDDVI